MTETLLDPLLVAKLATMELRARRVVEGALAGRHRSLRHGQSLEFAGHRAYSPSDEWRHIDWKVFARTDRWVVREQQDETNLRAVTLLDTSRSMSFGAEDRLPKLRYASILVAALSYLLIHRRESAGLGLFDGALRDFFPARGGAAHLARLLDRLEGVAAGPVRPFPSEHEREGRPDLTHQRGAGRPTGATASADGEATDFVRSLREAGQRLPRRSLILIVSDLWGPPEDVFAAVRVLLARKHEVAAIQVLDPAERDLPFRGDFIFQDLETGAVLKANAEEVRRDYERRVGERLDKIARVFGSLGVDHHVIWTDQPLDAGLSAFLGRRAVRRTGTTPSGDGSARP